MKEYNSMEEIEKDFFPMAYKKKMKEKRIAEIGIGKYLAEEFLESMKKALSN